MATTNSVTRNRLIEERKAWRKDRPFGFHAKPKVGDNGCVILGIGERVGVFRPSCVLFFESQLEGDNERYCREVDLKLWNCIIPGKKGTIWEGGHYPLKISFSNEYPARPPKVRLFFCGDTQDNYADMRTHVQCSFDKGFYHPNIYPSGTVCLSILNEDEQWRPSITLKQILTGIQDLLDTPNEKSPAQSEAFMDFTQRRKTYERKVKEQVKKYPSPV